MKSVQEAYEELVMMEDRLIAQTCEMAVSILKDELAYRRRGDACHETAREISECIQQREERLRRELFAIRWEKTVLACQFPDDKNEAEASDS
ncbi:hypothetical protein G3578_10570 [Brevibacillus sp. SYP-B805]|uniref:hypothetical protein n=1 Tax=Brevibacillus sp. SYP-B805 TaxID=1578199 RepID=UPI0013ECEFA7|nr:hypothetical protein [Brevibacillus sp. SYP-B805]NGQ95597.1 hypothetical protein [Brevibacillus sp. SYP-B805]